MFSCWPQTDRQFHVSINFPSLFRWVNMTHLSSLSHLLSVTPPTLSLYYLCNPSVSSQSSSSSLLALIFLRDSFCVCSFRALLTRATSLGNRLSSLRPLSRFIVRQLHGLPHAGDGEGLLLLMMTAGTLGDCYDITCHSKYCFCLSSLTCIYSLMLFWASLIFITLLLSALARSR